MRSENILSADILDLIFENRNKKYGAYVLRKHYNNRVVKALVIVFLLAAFLLVISKLFREPKERTYDIIDTIPIALLPNVEVEKPKLPKPPTPPKPPAAMQPTQTFVSNVAITNDNPTKLPDNLDNVAIGSTTHTGPETGPATVQPAEPAGGGGGTENTAPVAAIDNKTPRFTADVMPEFPGGMEALRKFMQRHLSNPDEVEPGTMVAVKIRFVVGYDGKLKSFEIVEDGGESFNKEVIRVLKKMPDWIPGKASGEKVSVYYTIPVKFTAME